MFGALAYIGIAFFWILILAKLTVYILEVARPISVSSRLLWNLRRYVPSWRLFGQSLGSFNIRFAIVDWPSDHPELSEEHIEPRHRRKLTEALINPAGRVRGLKRRAARGIIELNANGGHESLEASEFAGVIRRLAAQDLRRIHRGDTTRRSFYVFVILDVGFFSRTGPQALVRLGPYENDPVR